MRRPPARRISVAVLSSAPHGGAGIAAKRLAEALQAHGAAADFIDLAALGEGVPDDARPERSFSNRAVSDTHFTVEHPGFCRGWLVEMLAEYDIVNVHWALGLISLAELMALAERGTTLVFTLHDFHYVTGGCHYPAGCTRLGLGCHACPQLDRSLASPAIPPAARRFKQALFAHPNVHIVAPSHFVRDGAVASRIVPPGRAHVIRNPYAPHASDWAEPGAAVRLLLIADSLSERRKNMRLAFDALALLGERLAARADAPRLALDVVGASDPQTQRLVARTGLAATQHGRLADHGALTAIWRRSDLLLTPSLEDNWPNILVEAGAYGVLPVVGPGHGCEEFVRSFNYGTIARSYTADAFAEALEAALERRSCEARGTAARAIRIAHDPARIVAQFLGHFAPPASASNPFSATGTAPPTATANATAPERGPALSLAPAV